MESPTRLLSPQAFSEILYERMRSINAGIGKLDLNEFRYALENLYSEDGWESIELDQPDEIERMIRSRDYYESIQLRPRQKDRIVLDESIVRLTRMLFTGLERGKYNEGWVNKQFYFDVRGFFFLPRTVYFTDAVLAHFGSKPFRCFEPRQMRFESFQGVGYQDFQEANAEIDRAFIESLQKVSMARGTPMIITLAGPTAAGKTEITGRLIKTFEGIGRHTNTIEMDNFLFDREYRENKPMGKETTHFDLFKKSLQMILKGQKITIPRYDFINTTSSHDIGGNLKPGCSPLVVEPADIIFLEGNFPFHMEEIADLIQVKIVYLTDDPVRLKRKWKRDIDYRKKYDPAYFCNRFFKTQFLRAEEIYRPLMEVCDMVVYTSGAELWATPEVAKIIREF
jgi:uridine kinase